MKKNIRIRTKKKKSNDLWVAIGAIVAIVILAIVVFNLNKIFPSPQINMTEPQNLNVYATVDGVPIYATVIDEKYSKIPPEYQELYTKAFVLNQTINEILIEKDLKSKGIEINDQDVDAYIQNEIDGLIAQIGEERFKTEVLEPQGLTDASQLISAYRDEFRPQLVLDKFLEQFVSDEDIRAYYDENPDQFNKPEMINSAHILICYDGIANCQINLTEQEALAKIIDIRNQIVAGADFNEMAKNYSTGPSSVVGGLLGNTTKGQFVKEFDDVAWALQIGEISQPVKTEFGWHIIKLNDKIDSKLLKFEDVAEQVKVVLVSDKQQEIQNYYLNLWNDSDIKIFYFEKDTGAISGCTSGYGISANTVIFYHTDTCPHCAKMKPIVNELEGLGLNFYWANPADNTGEVVKGCFPTKYSQGVPQFICAGTGETLLGEQSKNVLEKFVNECEG